MPIFIFAAFAVGIFLRIFFSLHADFWSDELLSLNYALNPNPQSIYWDNTPPLFYFLLKQWFYLVPHDQLGLRSFNLLISLSAPVVAFVSSRRILSLTERWLFAALVSLSSLSFYFGTEIRVYGLVEVVSIWNLFLFLQAVKEKKWSWSLPISWLILLSLHYFTILFVAAQALIYFLLSPGQLKEIFNGRWRRVFVFLVLALIGLMIWGGVDLRFLRFRTLKDSTYYLTGMYQVFRMMCVGSNSFALLFAVLLWRDSKNRPLQALLYLCLLFSLGISVLLSMEVLSPRYFIFLNPVIVLLITKAFCEKEKINRVLAGLLILLNLWSVFQVMFFQKAGWKQAADYINENYTPMETKLFIPENQAFYYPYFKAFSNEAEGPPEKGAFLVLCKEVASETDVMNEYFENLKKKGFVVEKTVFFGPKNGETVFEVVALYEMRKKE